MDIHMGSRVAYAIGARWDLQLLTAKGDGVIVVYGARVFEAKDPLQLQTFGPGTIGRASLL